MQPLRVPIPASRSGRTPEDFLSFLRNALPFVAYHSIVAGCLAKIRDPSNGVEKAKTFTSGGGVCD